LEQIIQATTCSALKAKGFYVIHKKVSTPEFLVDLFWQKAIIQKQWKPFIAIVFLSCYKLEI